MADAVQVMMEKMIPELEDLQARRLFSEAEVRQIVAKRRDFEYALRRLPMRKIDALRYIEYELQLDALRAARKTRLGLTKTTLGDTAGVRRVHALFDRALRKFRGSVELWLQYVAFCQSEGSDRVLSHVFSRALQSHPRSAELWIEAASYEFASNLNVDSARVLMQRAIRLNKHSQKLWLEYFRLELLYVQKLGMRREVLRLDEATAAEPTVEGDSGTVLIDELPEEQQLPDAQEPLSEEMQSKQKARQAVLQGAIAQIVYTNAVRAIPDDVHFRLQFVAIRDLFGVKLAADVSAFILQDCLEAFPASEEVHAAQALRPLALAAGSATATTGESSEVDGADVSEAERQAELLVVHNFEASVKQLETVSMKELFADWLVARLASRQQTAFLLEYAKAKLKEFVFSEASQSSPALAVKYVDLVHRTEGTPDALLVVRKVCEEYQPQSAELWLLQAQLVLHSDADASVTHTEAKPTTKRRRTSRSPSEDHRGPLSTAATVLKTAVSKLEATDYDGHLAVRGRLLQLLVAGAGAATPSAVEREFQDALAAQKRGSALWAAVRQQYVGWAASAASHKSLAQTRALYNKFLLDEQLLPTPQTQEFLLLCVDVETAAPAPNAVQVRQLFEKLVELFGKQKEDVWVRYVRCLSERLALFADAARVQQRALRVWKESPRLTQMALGGM